MKKKNFLTSKKGTVILAIAAVALLGLSSVTGARAALQYRSETYSSQVQMYDIGVSLLENGTSNESIVSHRDYNSKKDDGSWDKTIPGNLLAATKDQDIIPGKPYQEELRVKNSGTIDEYVRVTIYKYWLEKDTNAETGYLDAAAVDARDKTQVLTPDLIYLHLVNEDDWILDENASTDERIVLYYAHRLEAGEVTEPLSDTFTIDSSIVTKVNEVREDDGTVRTTYAYDGYSYVLEARVDAVQDHNAQAAIKSAWGQTVELSGNDIRLAQ